MSSAGIFTIGGPFSLRISIDRACPHADERA